MFLFFLSTTKSNENSMKKCFALKNISWFYHFIRLSIGAFLDCLRLEIREKWRFPKEFVELRIWPSILLRFCFFRASTKKLDLTMST